MHSLSCTCCRGHTLCVSNASVTIISGTRGRATPIAALRPWPDTIRPWGSQGTAKQEDESYVLIWQLYMDTCTTLIPECSCMCTACNVTGYMSHCHQAGGKISCFASLSRLKAAHQVAVKTSAVVQSFGQHTVTVGILGRQRERAEVRKAQTKGERHDVPQMQWQVRLCKVLRLVGAKTISCRGVVLLAIPCGLQG